MSAGVSFTFRNPGADPALIPSGASSRGVSFTFRNPGADPALIPSGAAARGVSFTFRNPGPVAEATPWAAVARGVSFTFRPDGGIARVSMVGVGFHPCSYAIEGSDADFPAAGGTGQIAVTADWPDCPWGASAGATWITITQGVAATGSGVAQYAVAANTSSVARAATVSVLGTPFTVHQEGVACAPSLSNAFVLFDADGGHGSVTLTMGASDCAWEAASPAEWVTFSGVTSGSGSATIAFDVAATASSMARSTTLSIGGRSLEVLQSGVSCSFSLSPATASYDAPGGTGEIAVTAAASDCEWTAAASETWVEVTSGSPGTGSGTLAYRVTANASALGRGAAITVDDQSTAITQAGVACNPQFAPATVAVQAPGASGSATLTTAAGDCGWTLASNADWLTITSATDGTGSATVQFDVAPNLGAARHGTITGGDAALAIDQAGRHATVVDFEPNAKADVLLYQTTGAWSARLGLADGTFAAGPTGLWKGAWAFHAGDFDGDGDSDLFAYAKGSGKWTLAVRESGGFTIVGTGKWAKNLTVIPVDLNQDGRDDLLTYSAGTGTWTRNLTVTPGTFTTHSGSWGTGWQVAPADLNLDGRIDFLLYVPASGKWQWALNTSDTAFTSVAGTWGAGWKVYPGDYDGDGRTDVFLIKQASGVWNLLTNTSTGYVATPGKWTGGWVAYPGDFNGDGRTDLWLYKAASGLWTLQRHSGGGVFTATTGTWQNGSLPFVTDFNGDGQADVLLYKGLTGAYTVGLTNGPGTFRSVPGTWGTGMKVLATHAAPR